MPLDFEKYLPIVNRFALSLTRDIAISEELSQETMLRAVQHKATVDNLDDPRAWLFRVVTNLWRDWLRAKKRQPLRQVLTIELADRADDPRVQIEIREHLENVLRSFQDLPETQRNVLFLRTIEEFSIDEISDILNLSRNSVKVNLSHARKKMRQQFMKPMTGESNAR